MRVIDDDHAVLTGVLRCVPELQTTPYTQKICLIIEQKERFQFQQKIADKEFLN